MILIRFLIVGAVAGWMLGKATRGEGYGFFGNVIIGGIGSVIGWFLFGFLGFAISDWSESLVAAIVGAVLFFFLLSFLLPKRRKKERKSEDD